MALYGDLTERPAIKAANGKSVPALAVISLTLAYLKVLEYHKCNSILFTSVCVCLCLYIVAGTCISTIKR